MTTKYGDHSKVHHLNAYGFCAFPESAKTGRSYYMINEINVVFRITVDGPRPTRWPYDPSPAIPY